MRDHLKRRQHTVPKTLLRGFVDTKNRLAMRRRNGSANFTSLNDASVRSNFYSYRDSTGALNDNVEDWLSTDVEGPVTPILIRAREGQGPLLDDTVALARFAACGLLRTATIRSYLEQLSDHLGPLLLLQHHLSTNLIDPASLTPEGPARAQSTAATVWQMRGRQLDDERAKLRILLREFDKLNTRLSRWTWSLQTAISPCLITSDAPVATLPTDEVGWHGVLPAGSPVLIPVSPYRVLVGEENPVGLIKLLSPEVAELINARLAREAYDAVFCSPAMSWPDSVSFGTPRPTLPQPTIAWSHSGSESRPTNPAVYPEVTDHAVRKLLVSLEAIDEVE